VTQLCGGRETCFQEDSAFPNFYESNLTVRSHLGNDQLQFWSRGKSVGRVTLEYDVWPEWIQGLICA